MTQKALRFWNKYLLTGAGLWLPLHLREQKSFTKKMFEIKMNCNTGTYDNKNNNNNNDDGDDVGIRDDKHTQKQAFFRN